MRKKTADRKHSSSTTFLKNSYFVNPSMTTDLQRKESEQAHILNPSNTESKHEITFEEWDIQNNSDIKQSFLYSFPTGIEEFDVHDVSYHKSLQNYDSQYSSFYNIPSIDENAKR